MLARALMSLSRLFPFSVRRAGPGFRCLRAARWASIAILVCGFLVGFGPQGVKARGASDQALATMRASHLPPEGRATLAAIHSGGPFASPRDGFVFGNRERILPRQRRGYYAEYTVPTPGARNRGARRIIAGRGTSGDFRNSREYYYTDDHYRSFKRIRE